MDQINLAVVGFDGIQLLIPQSGIATIEMIDGMELSKGVPGAIGHLALGDREWPVFALDANLRRLTECTSTNRYNVAFDIDGEPAFALACDEVNSLKLVSADEIKPLQACMRLPRNPVEAMVLKDDKLMLMSQVDTLHRFLLMDLAA